MELSNESEWISLSEFSRRMGLTLFSVRKAIAQGRIKSFRQSEGGRLSAVNAILGADEWRRSAERQIQGRINSRAHRLASGVVYETPQEQIEAYKRLRDELAAVLKYGCIARVEIESWVPAVRIPAARDPEKILEE